MSVPAQTVHSGHMNSQRVLRSSSKGKPGPWSPRRLREMGGAHRPWQQKRTHGRLEVWNAMGLGIDDIANNTSIRSGNCHACLDKVRSVGPIPPLTHIKPSITTQSLRGHLMRKFTKTSSYLAYIWRSCRSGPAQANGGIKTSGRADRRLHGRLGVLRSARCRCEVWFCIARRRLCR